MNFFLKTVLKITKYKKTNLPQTTLYHILYIKSIKTHYLYFLFQIYIEKKDISNACIKEENNINPIIISKFKINGLKYQKKHIIYYNHIRNNIRKYLAENSQIKYFSVFIKPYIPERVNINNIINYK